MKKSKYTDQQIALALTQIEIRISSERREAVETCIQFRPKDVRNFCTQL